MEREFFLTLLTKKTAGALSSVEKDQLELAISTNKEYREIHDLLHYTSFQQNPVTGAQEALVGVWKKIETENHQISKAPVRRMRYAWLAAACIVVIMILNWPLSTLLSTSSQRGLFTLSAQHKKLDTVLTDGSRIILSEKSELSIAQNFGKDTRSLALKGNAFFDVAKNESIPMIVQAGPVTIHVKGTAFSVDRSQAGQLQIQLLRGLVEVRNQHDPRQKTMLYPGQTLFVAENAENELRFALGSLPANSPLNTVFGNDTLRFSNTPLDSLVMLLAKKYETKIEIRNQSLKARRFSGMFVTETLQEVLAALQFTYPFSVRTEDQKTIIE